MTRECFQKFCYSLSVVTCPYEQDSFSNIASEIESVIGDVTYSSAEFVNGTLMYVLKLMMSAHTNSLLQV